MTVVLLGLFIFLIGISPDLIGMDRSPVVGFVQVGVWLTGLAALLLGTYLTIRVIRNGRNQTLRADVGVRLMATGYVVAGAASLADFIGIGSHTLPGLVFGSATSGPTRPLHRLDQGATASRHWRHRV